MADEIEFKDVTEDYCCLGLFGPKSRDLLKKISNDDFSNENFKFGTAKFVKIKHINVWAQRLSYVGEIGFEIYVENQLAKELYNMLILEGKNFYLAHCGMHAMDIMRMESGFLHWGHDISPEENQYQAGLSFAISYNKNVDFVGKNALLKIKEQKPKKQFVMLTLQNSTPGEPLLLHDEPIYLNNQIIGRTTSGNYSFCFNKNLSFGYVSGEISKETLKKEDLSIEIANVKYAAKFQSSNLNKKNFKTI